MAIIELENLAKTYRVYQKREGLGASIRGLFRREHRMVEAVRGIFQVLDGQPVARERIANRALLADAGAMYAKAGE